jgi:hypothetical protein
MATYYVNAGSSTQDGLTPDTGCHNLTLLSTTVSLVDEDIVYFVDNGNIIEDPATIDKVLSIYSWSSNINRPTWVLPEYNLEIYAPTFSFVTPTLGTISIRNIRIQTSGILSGLGFGGANTTFDIRYCYFDQALVEVGLLQSGFSNSFVCANNIFTNMPLGYNLAYITVHVGSEFPEALCDCKIICNTFYGNDIGVQFYEHVSGKVYGNIFLNQASMCVYRGGGDLRELWSVEIDYNITYGWNHAIPDFNISDPPPDLNSWIGPHNLRDVDPALVDPDNGVFNLTDFSPCFNALIGHNIDADIPTDDYNGFPRDLFNTFIGSSNALTFYSPTFVITPVDSIKNPGQDTFFYALAISIPFPTYEWRHDSTLLTDNEKIIGSSTSILTVKNLQIEDQGVYSVRASNTILPDATAQASLTLKSFPQFFAADFTVNVTNGITPLLADFTNLTIGQPDATTAIFIVHDWKFGDGSIDATTLNASRIYTIPGSHTVSLSEFRDFVGSIRIKEDYISTICLAVNYYNNFPLRNDATVKSFINLPVLFPMLNGDPYFTDETQIGRVNLYFRQEDGWQKKLIIHTGPDLTGSEKWTPNALPGLWRLTEIRVFDTDGAEHYFGRDNTTSDLSLT